MSPPNYHPTPHFRPGDYARDHGAPYIQDSSIRFNATWNTGVYVGPEFTLPPAIVQIFFQPTLELHYGNALDVDVQKNFPFSGHQVRHQIVPTRVKWTGGDDEEGDNEDGDESIGNGDESEGSGDEDGRSGDESEGDDASDNATGADDSTSEADDSTSEDDSTDGSGDGQTLESDSVSLEYSLSAPVYVEAMIWSGYVLSAAVMMGAVVSYVGLFVDWWQSRGS